MDKPALPYNNTLELYMYQKEACIQQMRGLLDKITMEKCQGLINSVIEARYSMVLDNQRSKFEILYQQKTDGHSNSNSAFNHSNLGTNTKDTRAQSTMSTSSTWVKNLSSTPWQKPKNAFWPMGLILPQSPNVHPIGSILQ